MKLFNHLRTLNTHHRILRNRFHPLFNTTNFFSDASSTPHVQQPSPPSSLHRTPHFRQPSPPSTLNRYELAKFASAAESRYYRMDSEGYFKPLHVMNPTRIAFNRPALRRHFSRTISGARKPKVSKANVKSKGRARSELVAQMGATVTDTDESCCTTSEKLDKEGRTFDAVRALKVGAVFFVCLKVLGVNIPFFLKATIDVMAILLEISLGSAVNIAGNILAFFIFGATIIYIGAISIAVCATIICIGAISIAVCLIAAAITCTAVALITPGLICFYTLWLTARKIFGFAA